ncbi:hypothetical protein MPTK1_5g20620 [Marchantia polymorpha subsp. ruderalis]|uniref:RING-type domain-containing protein n=2 Tax=Marchantia polymorpha TaxID=3197 RepID=A0AAF6BKG5_MARPO|nr:hypothetical protein MARPO_0058s0040 [Marchantia polymorpha]BBN12499.1 hypothetical protein Mp_5g20620 [Marchantia polymorpha subsp. ruderalis]|eukprot:PTQ37251.1 hypothetical protein MARPO_0058s0040 [Marchantia polymorpha]
MESSQLLTRPPAAVMTQFDRKTEALNQNKACFTFIMLSMFIGTFWLLLGPYGTTTLALDVNTSRLLTAHSFFAKSMKFSNKGEFRGPVLYGLHNQPALDSEVKWSDYQNMTMNYWHQEFYYYLNKGSTVRMKSNVKIPDRNVVYFKVIRGKEDLEAFVERPDEASIRLHDYLEYKYEATSDDDHIFAFANTHHVDAEVEFELDIHSTQYNVHHANEKCDLKSHCELELSLFGSRYAVLVTPGVDESQVDNWEIEVGYGTRWMSIIVIYSFVVLLYLVRKSMIMKSIHDIEDANSERSPLVAPEDAQSDHIAPTAPEIPSSIPEEEEYPYRKDKDVSEDQLCSVCLDAPKASFFVPCGHRATCYLCGLRISMSEKPTCPICRQAIGEVKKIFDA